MNSLHTGNRYRLNDKSILVIAIKDAHNVVCILVFKWTEILFLNKNSYWYEIDFWSHLTARVKAFKKKKIVFVPHPLLHTARRDQWLHRYI